jgi:23S rRNA (cytidine1920-2'-O)/16S rRNA (cytidine1409-2'-O)-methyltransferase
MSKKRKERLDKLLVEKGFIQSREKARALIMGGRVWVDGSRVDKAGKEVDIEADIVCEEASPFVSRGGLKLQGALDYFRINVKDKIILDVGASTGGFTDCLLKEGAQKVYALDVGYGLLDWSLRKEKKVVPIERRNIRHFTADELDEKVDVSVIDVSFISLKKVIPSVIQCTKKGGVILPLIKPQFEVGRGEVGKGGIVKDPEKHKLVVESMKKYFKTLGLDIKGTVESPIRGAKGNKEFWIYAVV